MFTKKLPMIMQGEMAECGLACIAMILNYYGHEIDLNTLRLRYPITLEGANLQKLLNISASLNLAARPLKLDLNSLNKLQTPAILHWQMTHFVVLQSINGKKVTIHDPSVGVISLPMKEVSNAFTGIAIELVPSTTFQPKKELRKIGFRDLFDNFIGLRKDFFLLVMLSIAVILFSLASPFFLQIIIDGVNVSKDKGLLIKIALGFLIIVLSNSFVLMLRSYITLHLGCNLNYRLTVSFFKHLIRLPLSFFERRHTADILSRFMSVLPIQEFLTQGAVLVIVEGIITIVSLIFMCVYSLQLTAIVVFAGLIYFFSRIIYVRYLKTMQDESIMISAEENAVFLETLSNMPTIKLYGNETQREVLWTNKFQKSLNKKTYISKYEKIYYCLNQLIFGIENVLVVYLGALLVIENSLTAGMFIAYITYKKMFTEKLCLLIDKLIEVNLLYVHLQRLGGIALTQKDNYYDKVFTLDHTLKGFIEVKKIWFQYDDSNPFVLKDISFKVKEGESIAIVGPSGCGKTTLMKIMMGLLKPSLGRILIDGVDIHDNQIIDYRKYIGAVLQDDNLFSGTIFKNISLFDENATFEQVEKSAKLALIHDDIQRKTLQYNTLVGDMGNTLSGGQKQRILLARALYRKPKILFLDEATSHLDSKVESDINAAIKQLDITRIIIAHRPSTIQSADRIFSISG